MQATLKEQQEQQQQQNQPNKKEPDKKMQRGKKNKRMGASRFLFKYVMSSTNQPLYVLNCICIAQCSNA